MADDVKPEVIKKTQDLLGKYFKKPPLTEKLLRKPPFRFLHDIVSAVINETGFLEGLYTEDELNSENIKNKEAKLAYLTKLIDVVKLCTGINLTVRASKIVSGQEPTRTNELLQAIGKALDKKINSADVIEQYKKGSEKGKSPSSRTSIGKEERKPSSKQASQTRITTSKERSTERRRRPSNDNTAAINDIEARKNGGRESEKNGETSKVRSAESSQEKVPPSAHRKKSSSARHKPTPLTETLNPVQVEKKVDETKKQKESENRSKHSARAERNEFAQNQIAGTSNHAKLEPKLIADIKDNKISEDVEREEHKGSETTNNDISLQNIEKPDEMVAEASKTSTENDVSVSQSISRPRTSLRPPTSRPISARPAAPRIRGKADLMVNEEILTPMGNISVIVENSDFKEDDDAEDMVVMETRAGGGDSLDNSINYKIDEQLTQEHGHLVAQILETQKELVNNENVDVMPKKTNITWDSSSKRDMVAKEVDKLRNTIQTLTRATNPLGKLFDYFQEDVEIMLKELLDWRNQYEQVNEQLRVEKMKTQELIEPMKETLKEIDYNMKEQLDKICQAKSQIMKNDQRIQTLLNGRA